MSWRRTSTPSLRFLANAGAQLVAKLRDGWTLEGTILRKGQFIENERQDVIDYCIEQNLLRLVSTKPAKYELVD